jgi:hypothetical protein
MSGAPRRSQKEARIAIREKEALMKRLIFARTASALAALAVLASATGASAAELIQNGSFETPYLGPFNWTEPGHPSYSPHYPEELVYPYPTLDGWTYDNVALVDGQAGSDWYGPIPRTGFDGYQFAALQTTGSLSQYFVSPGGELTLSWLSGGRPDLYGTEGGDQTYAVEVDGASVGTFSTASGQIFAPETLPLTDVSAGFHELIFKGLATQDETAFLDDVSIVTGVTSPVSTPEPATWMLMLAGFGALGMATRLRGKQTVALR